MGKNKYENLKTNFLGIELASPVMISSGPISDSQYYIEKWSRLGAGAVITKSISSNQDDYKSKKGTLQILKIESGALNASTYSHKTINTWKKIISDNLKNNIFVIPNIFERSVEKMVEVAVEISKTGCKAIELGISCPNDDNKQEMTLGIIKDYITKIKAAIKTPIILKLPSIEGFMSKVKVAVDSGVDAISISDTLPGIKVDLERKSIYFNGRAGYSGKGIKPIILESIYRIRKAGITVPILGIGGVETAEDVLEYLHLGVSAVQICTSLMYGQDETMLKIMDGLNKWCEKNNTKISEIKSLI